MGTIHLFLGVESASAERLGYLGRTHEPTHNESAIAACRAANIVPSFNFMLFDPDSSLDDVEASLSLAERHLDLPWNGCRTEIYSGTALRDRLEAEGRLEQGDRLAHVRVDEHRDDVCRWDGPVPLHRRLLVMNALVGLSE